MIRVTTPTHRFQAPIEANMIKRMLLTYRQAGKIVLEKTKEDMSNDGYMWFVTLTQQETKRFIANIDVEVQVRIFTTEGQAPASKIKTISVERVLNDEVLE